LDCPEPIAAIARRLCGADVISMQLCDGGGNNRVYRILTRDGAFAGKLYGSRELDDRDRLGHEYDGLKFLEACGIGRSVPAALAVDRAARFALYEWIDGAKPANHGATDVTAALDLLAFLHRARTAEGAERLPVATESVLRLADLVFQIESRFARLNEVAPSEPELGALLETELRPELERRLGALADWDTNAPLPSGSRTLSPSDFGFHNAIRRPDGSLAFIDFEYFGWDDPVKLTADFLWHPAMQLSAAERRRFLDGVSHLYAEDATFSARLAVCFPLYGIRWALIILNEFIPQLWARRAFSGKGGDRQATKREQLRKARAKLATLRSYREGSFDV
jgi:Ser/Thr protein kinase RdoA (MazF antagonist)